MYTYIGTIYNIHIYDIWIVWLYDIEWYQCTNFRTILSVLRQQETHPICFSSENPARKSKKQIWGIFFVEIQPSQKQGSIWVLSFRSGQAQIIGYLVGRGAVSVKSLQPPWCFPGWWNRRYIEDALIQVTPPWGILRTYGLPVTFPFLESPDFSEFAESPDESLPRSLLKHQLVSISLMFFEMLS